MKSSKIYSATDPEIQLLLYKGRNYKNNSPRQATTAIYAQWSYIVLRLPSICPTGRADISFDEKTFNIYVNIHKEGKLKVYSRPHMRNGKRKLICLQGFLKSNKLDYEDVKGVYSIQWIDKPKSFSILYMTRRKELIVSKDDKRKVTICLSAQEKENWDRVRGQLSMSTFVRSAVNRYLEDEHLI